MRCLGGQKHTPPSPSNQGAAALASLRVQTQNPNPPLSSRRGYEEAGAAVSSLGISQRLLSVGRQNHVHIGEKWLCARYFSVR